MVMDCFLQLALRHSQDEVETMGTMVADLGERLQQLDQQVVALDARVGTVPYQVRFPLQNVDIKPRALDADPFHRKDCPTRHILTGHVDLLCRGMWRTQCP